MFLNFFLQSSTVVSDTVSNAVANANSTPTTTDSVSYLDFLLKGGIMIIPIIILLFFCIYVIVERYLSIKKATRQDENMINDVRIQLKSGKIDNAIMMCGRGNTASGNIIKSGISIIGRPISEIESVMEKTANVEIAEMEKGLGYLGLISGIAPILGFIGTISGGLYEKMISSGAGLVVGVVAYSAYHLFNMMIDHFSLKVQKQTLEIINVIQQP